MQKINLSPFFRLQPEFMRQTKRRFCDDGERVVRLLIVISVIWCGGCSYSETFLISGPLIGARLHDIDNHRIEIGEIALHVQPRNEVKIRDTTYLWFVPVSSVDMRLSKGSPFEVDFFVLAQVVGYSFVPSKVQLVVNDKMPVSPKDISGPVDHSKHYGGALVHAIRHATGMIECMSGTGSFVGEDVSHTISIGDVKKWMCYKLYFDIEPPSPEDQVHVLVSDLKKSKEPIKVPLLPFEKTVIYSSSSVP